MDTLAHGLWAGFLAKGNEKSKKESWITVLFGVLPDLLSFGWVFVLIFYQRIVLQKVLSFGPGAVASPAISFWTNHIYDYTHSLIIWGLVFGLVYLLTKKIYWPLYGWLLHILIDIPTHTLQFYPTPFLWPASNYRFSGISWGQGWFMALNYGSMLVVYLFFKYKLRAKR